MAAPLVLAIDQGTGSTKALVVDQAGRVVGRGQCPIGLATPEAGWVEQDAEEIWTSVRKAIAEAVGPDHTGRIVAIGLSTQRESCVIWDARTGAALTPLLSWQDQRTLGLCRTISTADQARIRAITGLPLDPMFSAVKAQWLLDRIDPDRARARAGALRIGTIDSFLLARFGAEHVVEIGNASRMQLIDLETADFDAGLLDLFAIPRQALPQTCPSAHAFARAKGIDGVTDGTPVLAVLADSHAALFAHGAFTPGKVKATQGTGSSIMGLYDPSALDGAMDAGVCRTIAWQVDAVAYAFEGNIRSVGSTLVWLADLFGITPRELAALSASVADSGGLAVVPAFGGLGAPYWDPNAVGLIGGIVLGTSRAQIARAAVESIAHQIVDVLDRVRQSGLTIEQLFVDGGPTQNDQLMQLEADLAGVTVARPNQAELSALGAAHLAGLMAGIWSLDDLGRIDRSGTTFQPVMAADRRHGLRQAWAAMVARSRGLAVA